MTEPLSQQTTINGFSLHYWDWPGSGPAIVCLHPSGHYGRIWEWVAQRLAPDFRVVAPDQRGHGDSTHPAGGNSAQDYASDVEELRKTLGLDRFVLAGHSLGARTAMAYAAEYPERVSQVVLVGGPHYSTLHPGADVEYWQNNAARTRARARRNPSAEEARAVLKATYPNHSDAALDHAVRYNLNHLSDGSVEWKYEPDWVADGLAHALDDLRGCASRISSPVLILRAEKSWELTPERMQEVEQLLPTSKTVTLPGTTQNLELEAPEQVAEAIRTFVRQQPA